MWMLVVTLETDEEVREGIVASKSGRIRVIIQEVSTESPVSLVYFDLIKPILCLPA